MNGVGVCTSCEPADVAWAKTFCAAEGMNPAPTVWIIGRPHSLGASQRLSSGRPVSFIVLYPSSPLGYNIAIL